MVSSWWHVAYGQKLYRVTILESIKMQGDYGWVLTGLDDYGSLGISSSVLALTVLRDGG